MNATSGRAWKGLLASLIVWGTGQFFSGARSRGIIWFTIGYVGPFFLLILYCSPLVPAKAGAVLLAINVIVWLAMLYDSYRPISPLRWWGWILLIIASLTFAELSSVTAHRLFHASRVPTGSMAPTISPGDDIFISRCAYWLHPPRRGDIIVFRTSGIAKIPKDPSGKEVMHDKRIVGLPGDRIEIVDPEILVNGAEMKFGDPAHPIAFKTRRREILEHGAESYVVPDGQYFVLGDNSANSYDSRYFGPISRDAIYGKVTKIYWPRSRISTPR